MEYLETVLIESMRSLTVRLASATDRQEQIASHVGLLKLEEEDQKSAGYYAIDTVSMPAPNSSLPMVPIVSKNKITINDLIRGGADIVHSGKILLCRTILSAAKLSNMILLVDDPGGKYVVRLALYNYLTPVPVGTILAIMHPWFKLTVDGSAGLRCENPMHVHFVKSTDSILRKVIWKAELPVESGVKTYAIVEGDDPSKEGYRFYLSKNYDQALDCYTKAVELKPDHPILLSNRALTYLALQKPLEALHDAEAALILDRSHLKSLYRKGRALLMLKEYEKATKFLDETYRRMKEEISKDDAFMKLIGDSEKMFEEFKTGNYDLIQMNEESKKNIILKNHADYAASLMFQIQDIEGKGRGLVATCGISAGTLIMAFKAFAFAPVGGQICLATNWHAGTTGLTGMVAQISKKLMNNPELCPEFYQLYAGPDLGVIRECDPSKPVDIERISAIVRTNLFNTRSAGRQSKISQEHMGLWLLPSYLNHSCVDNNCFWTIIGDFMFIRTTKNIYRGEELLIGYVPATNSFKDRSRVLENLFGFECECRLCVVDRNDPPYVRERFLNTEMALNELKKQWAKKAFCAAYGKYLEKRLVEVLEYRPDKTINFLACRIRDLLTDAVLFDKPMEALKLFEYNFHVFLDAGEHYQALCIASEAFGRAKAAREFQSMEKWSNEMDTLKKLIWGDERVGTIFFLENLEAYLEK